MRGGAGLGQRDSARARRGLWLARLAVPCPAAPAAVDEQAVDGIWHAVQSRAHGWQAAERLPPFPIVEADLEHNAPAASRPCPVDSTLVSTPSISASSAVPATGKPRTRRAVPGSTTIQPLRRWYVLLLDPWAPHRADLSESGGGVMPSALARLCVFTCQRMPAARQAVARFPGRRERFSVRCPARGSLVSGQVPARADRHFGARRLLEDSTRHVNFRVTSGAGLAS